MENANVNLDYLTTDQAQLYVNVSRQRLYQKGIKRIKENGRVMWSKADLDAKFKENRNKNKNINVPVTVDDIDGIPEFIPDEAAQKAFDEIVDDLGDDYRTVHNGVIESLLLVQHTKRYYHKMVIDNPLSHWSKLLDQSIRQEISILKVLGLTR